jgi:hypothetical protein
LIGAPQGTPLARLEPAELDPSVCDAQQPRHLVAGCAHHSSNLAIAPFGQFDDQMRFSSGALSNDDGIRPHVVETFPQTFRTLVGEQPADDNHIPPRHLGRRIRQPRRQPGVGRQQ